MSIHGQYLSYIKPDAKKILSIHNYNLQFPDVYRIYHGVLRCSDMGCILVLTSLINKVRGIRVTSRIQS